VTATSTPRAAFSACPGVGFAHQRSVQQTLLEPRQSQGAGKKCSGPDIFSDDSSAIADRAGLYSITSSARASSVGSTSRLVPSQSAFLHLGRLLRQHLVQPIVDYRIGRQITELAGAIGPLSRRKDAPGHRATYAPSEVLEEVHSERVAIAGASY
jgi:hypothetical protein